MNKLLRRAVVGLCAVFVCVMSIFWSVLAGSRLAEWLRGSVHEGAPGKNVTPSTFSAFYQLSFLGICLATASSVVVFFWDARPAKRARIAICFIVLIVLVPLSAVNFHYGDYLMTGWAQAVLDFVLVCVGLTAVFVVWEFEVQGVFVRVVKAMVVFLLLLESVVLPGMYAILWLLWWQGVPVNGATDHIVSGTAATVSAVIAVINFAHKRKSSTAEKSVVIIGGN